MSFQQQERKWKRKEETKNRANWKRLLIYLKFDGSGVVCVVCESTLQTNLKRRCCPFPLIVSFVCCAIEAVEFVMNRFHDMGPNVKANSILKKKKIKSNTNGNKTRQQHQQKKVFRIGFSFLISFSRMVFFRLSQKRMSDGRDIYRPVIDL